jgi:hypothetical protein
VLLAVSPVTPRTPHSGRGRLPFAVVPARDAERTRLQDDAWRRWGPYVSERAWGTVREDYSAEGDAWSYFPHDEAR